jgi:hypothetical protein
MMLLMEIDPAVELIGGDLRSAVVEMLDVGRVSFPVHVGGRMT